MKSKKERPDKIVFETFRKIGDYNISNMTEEEPTCFNSIVSIKKYKVTIELISEPKEIYKERLQKLWDECDNYHYAAPLRNAAKEIDFVFKNSWGSKRLRH